MEANQIKNIWQFFSVCLPLRSFQLTDDQFMSELLDTAFVPGQRWINEAELELGLGTIMSVEHRTVTLVFIATGETRSYAKVGSPLARIRFSGGDTISYNDGQALLVESVTEEEGLLFYSGTDSQGNHSVVPEGWLDHFLQFNRPTERLFSGQIDHLKWFELRQASWHAYQKLHHSDLRGLTGSRTNLIPHQIYIAHEVAKRYAPRVLLADEVGLGKTIEAGLILNHQLLSGRATRVLIVVPETLLHQWLVEMLRRFNLRFSLFDAERCADFLEHEGSDANPFQSEQLVLCSLDFLRDHPEYNLLAQETEWDLLVVDEAHHLEWSEESASPEYLLIENLALQIPGVLLLTATPEQLGKESHFARLRLLDADRFSSFEQFVEEEKLYQPIADAVELLLSGKALDESTLAELKNAELKEFFDEDDNHQLIKRLHSNPDDHAVREALLTHLLDRHGTGRILFRNTRAGVQGFPARQLHAYSLPAPVAYTVEIRSHPSPEQLFRQSTANWQQIDPRVEWLLQHLKQHRNAKQLVITASAETALDLAEVLRVKAGIHAAVFHEGMSIIERDRAAAFFADKDDGSQLLICSEIGSEGRNFQFAHHLVLFDLPLNPDLLEQRIGRLDRIGQTEVIQIHVPYLEESAQQVLFHWYHQGLNAFEHPNPAGYAVYQKLADQLQSCLQQDMDIDQLVASAFALNKELNEQLHNGRDRLLEYNSCRPADASQLIDKAQQQELTSTLPDYMEAIFDCFGVESESHSSTSQVIHPSSNMSEPFPGLPNEGTTITYDRATALTYEDIQYLNWDHSMVNSAMDMVISSERGNTSLVSVDSAPLKKLAITPGMILLETLFVLESPQHTSRYLPPSTIRLLVDESNRQLGRILQPELLQKIRKPVKRSIASQAIKAKRDDIQALIKTCEVTAQGESGTLIEDAIQNARQLLNEEVNRLKALQRINPNVRDSEIKYYQDELTNVEQLITSVALRLDAVRVIVAM